MDLQTALDNGDCTAVWVAAGVYLPTTATPLGRTISFDVCPGVAVYGGFADGETDGRP